MRNYTVINYYFFLILLFLTLDAGAATPVNGQTDCGLIQGSVFYSDTYPPPSGTPVSSGSCSWVRTSNSICATRNYGGTNYNLYPHSYICNLPFDQHIALLIAFSIILGCYGIKKKSVAFFYAQRS